MAYTVKISDRLLPKCAYIRKAVFMEEQGFQQEFDEIDDRAYHALILDGETPGGSGTAVYRRWKNIHHRTDRRYAVVSGKASGRTCGDCSGRAGEGLRRSEHCTFAQCRVAGFYEKLGYTQTDDFHMDEFCPHVTMRKQL